MKEWQQKIAYLPQDLFLIDDTLKKNITIGIDERDISNEKLNDVVKKTELLTVVDDLNDGIDTFIGEHGIKISGGQKQRIALARALYHNKEILILDEATSALDSETEREIVKQIKLMKGKYTIILISHKMSTIKLCDYVYKVSEGNIFKIT